MVFPGSQAAVTLVVSEVDGGGLSISYTGTLDLMGSTLSGQSFTSRFGEGWLRPSTDFRSVTSNFADVYNFDSRIIAYATQDALGAIGPASGSYFSFEEV